ncbi:MAG: bifunctional phosphoglucose/phosphomannose isomerase [Candidatus Neomarinimicrobiota bacterium]|nr:MAG: bifunctional phosphoglucose/phosphomannose isomerase [Candidatus Neomarinimicrobiota bacterium]
MTNDPQHMKQAIFDFPDHIGEAITIGRSIHLRNTYRDIQNVVICGMGGSAIGGDVVRVLIRDEIRVPLYVNRHYRLPHWVNSKSLVIASSYSGNTEETLSAFEEARQKGAHILGITTGGTLAERLKADHLDVVLIPGGLQPRAALAFSFVPMLFLLRQVGVIQRDWEPTLNAMRETLHGVRDQYARKIPENPTYALAGKLAHSLPVIYGETDFTAVAAIRWKGQLAENSKMLAYVNELPELNHNEIVGWENNADLLERIVLVWLEDKDSHPRVKIRHQISEKILNSIGIKQETVETDGDDPAIRFLHCIHYGDWVSYWCAMAHGTDPTPVHKISQLKKELSQIS